MIILPPTICGQRPSCDPPILAGSLAGLNGRCSVGISSPEMALRIGAGRRRCRQTGGRRRRASSVGRCRRWSVSAMTEIRPSAVAGRSVPCCGNWSSRHRRAPVLWNRARAGRRRCRSGKPPTSAGADQGNCGLVPGAPVLCGNPDFDIDAGRCCFSRRVLLNPPYLAGRRWRRGNPPTFAGRCLIQSCRGTKYRPSCISRGRRCRKMLNLTLPRRCRVPQSTTFDDGRKPVPSS